MTEIEISDRKLYLVRHGDYNEQLPGERLSSKGREQIALGAQRIIQDLDRREIGRGSILLFSSGFPRALDSIMEIGATLDFVDYGLEVHTSPTFYGSNQTDSENSFNFLGRFSYSCGIVACHKEFLAQFPRLFMNRYHPERSMEDFRKTFKNGPASTAYLDFKTGELVDLSADLQ